MALYAKKLKMQEMTHRIVFKVAYSSCALPRGHVVNLGEVEDDVIFSYG